MARELTKLHEEVARGSLAELCEWCEDPVKGEVVVVVQGAPDAAEATDEQLRAAVRALAVEGMSHRDAAAAAAAAHGVSRRRVYNLVLQAES